MKGRCLGFFIIFASCSVWVLSNCASKRTVALSTVTVPELVEFPIPDAATELVYVYAHKTIRDSIRVFMIGPDSCLDRQGGSHVSVLDYLELNTRLVLKRNNSAFTFLHDYPCTLNGRLVRFRGLSAEAGADMRLMRVHNTPSLPAFAANEQETLQMVAVKHRSTLPDPLGLSKGSILNYRYTHRDSLGSEQTETITLVVSRFDQRVSGIFERFVVHGTDTLKRYGMLNAELEPYSSVAVLWLKPDSYCRPRPADFSGACQLFWLRRDMVQHLLRTQPTTLLLNSYEQEQVCALNFGEHDACISSYRLRLNGANAAVDACEFNFPGGRAGFIPCAANPLLLYVSLPSEGIRIELIDVKP